MRNQAIGLLIFLTVPFLAKAQPSSAKVKVFLDCTQQWLCDFDYVRTEIRAVDFVRDRFQSDVHVLINTQFSSSGGEQQQVIFIGMNRFQSMTDTLDFFNDPTATEDDKRKQLVHYLQLGLTRYIAKTAAAKDFTASFKTSLVNETDSVETTVAKDQWNYWVYQFGGNTNLNGNQNYKSSYFYGYISADRETENWKTNFYISMDQQTQSFKDGAEESKFKSRSYDGGVRVSKSISQHWSYGLAANYMNDLYRNVKTGFNVRPRLEYSLYPYKKFNSQRIVAQYIVGPVFNQYYDSTIYFKSKEWQIQQTVNIITSFNKPWGNINIGVFFSNYFDDLSKNNLSFNGAINWKITTGLNFGIYGSYAIINDQIALRKGEATRDEILVKNRELLSSFQYNVGVGFSYRFGSIKNSIVNPRFKGLSYSVNF